MSIEYATPSRSITETSGDSMATDTLSIDAAGQLFAAIKNGHLDPHTAGLFQEWASADQSLVGSSLYPQLRVARWGSDGIREGEIVKLRSMYDLTDKGENMANLLTQAGYSTKETGDIRIPPLARVARKLSLDELPQLMVNVGGMYRDAFPDAIDMKLIGGGRPVLRREIDLRGDNANDTFAHALEAVAAEHPMIGNLDTHEAFTRLGEFYVPGLLTPATAAGNRQLNTQADWESWIRGILEYAEISRLPQLKRTIALGKIGLQSAKHVVMGTNAG